MPLTLFEFLGQTKIDTFLIKLNQCEKTGSMRKKIVSLRKVDHVIVTFTLLQFSIVDFGLLLTKKMN